MNAVSNWVSRTTHAAVGFCLILVALSTPAWALPHGPEIDPGSMASALTLLIGGSLLITGRSRKR
jgi:hypothetical protein